jgi:hypothetical protein
LSQYLGEYKHKRFRPVKLRESLEASSSNA